MSPILRLVTAAALLLGCLAQIRAESEGSRIGRLIEALDDENLRYGASIALARSGTKAVPELRTALAGGKPERRVWSAYTLGEIGAPAECAVGDLIKALENSDSALRAAAAQALGKIGPSSARSVVVLGSLLSDEVTAVRRSAAVALGQIGPNAAQAAPQLVAALKSSQTRQSARDALIQIGKSASPAVQQSLDDDEVRFDAAVILTETDPDTARRVGISKPTLADLASLRRALHDLTRPQSERSCAASALATLGSKGMAVLVTAFREQQLAGIAAAAFANVGADGVAPLLDALSDQQPQVRAAAANALGHIGPQANEAVPQLVHLFRDDDHHVRDRAVRALDAFGQQASPAVPDLIQFMLDSSQREPARQWAIMTLVGTLPETREEVVEGLIKASQDKGNYGVSSLAKLQVRKIAPEAAEAAGIR